jgi:hypothetical protein
MGVTTEERRRHWMDEILELRADMEHLQTAPQEELESRIPVHCERLDRMMETLFRSSRHAQ